ncbi:MAG: RluA family pseudouridine synthase [candidate division WOR-3 bacterium]|jgi:23S rRNA pseudouridine1911/1915/1917 synthase
MKKDNNENIGDIREWREVVRSENIRLDTYLSKSSLPFSRSHINKKIKEGEVLVNGEKSKPSYLVKKGDIVEFTYKPRTPFEINPQEIPIFVLYEDEDIIVLNKQKGMVVHPAKGNSDGTLVNALLYYCSDLSEGSAMDRPGVIHRLDEDTTGVIVFAKTQRVHAKIADQFQKRKVNKIYLALVWGTPPMKEGKIVAPIGRSPFDRKLMAVTPLNSRDSVTKFKILYSYGFASILKVLLETGRTHQIRVHLSHLGYPVIGDPGYGGRDKKILRRIGLDYENVFDKIMEIIDRQALHAASIEFTHPANNKKIKITAPLHGDMKKLIKFLNEVNR